MTRTVAALLVAAAAASGVAAAGEMLRFRLPPHPPADRFGNIVISRSTANGPVKPVSFSHSTHRLRYTCRVCHLELDFAFRRNSTPITEADNKAGAYCGACHNGKTAFGHTEANCGRCHTGNDETESNAFAKVAELPWAKYGNGVDWSWALASGRIAPAGSLTADFKPLTLDRTLTLEAEWNFVPPAIFPHAEHVRWLDCANCHPAIFNVKKKTTRHFSMKSILAGEFCGVCHIRVAFPIDDCERCHPDMKNQPR